MNTEMTRQESLESLANDWAKTYTKDLATALIGYKDVIMADYAKFAKDLEFVRDNFGVEFAVGNKYVKVITVSAGGSRSVHSFVDSKTGDIWKAASWKAPAKNFARGNVFNQSTYIKNTRWTGVC